MRLMMLVATGATALALAAPQPAASQDPDGCPWCVTPTKCDQITQSTPIGGCMNQGEGCEEIEGTCEYLQMLLPETRREFITSQGLTYYGTATVTLHGLEFLAFGVAPNLYARWSCDGRAESLFTQSEQGSWVTLDPQWFNSRYDLDLSMTEQPAGSGPTGATNMSGGTR